MGNFVFQIGDYDGEKQAWLIKNNDRDVTEVVIPDNICFEDFQVPLTRIEADCFAMCHKLKSISLPSTLKRLGDNCFSYCFALKEIRLPYNLELIGCERFRGSGLTKVTIPSSVRYIYNGAFRGCYALTEIQVLGANTVFGRYCFADSSLLSKILFAYDDVHINESCVSGCTRLTEDTIMHIKAREKSKVEIIYLRYEQFIDRLFHSRFALGCKKLLKFILIPKSVLGEICFLLICILLFFPLLVVGIAYLLGTLVMQIVERKFNFQHNNDLAYIIACLLIGLILYILLSFVVVLLITGTFNIWNYLFT